MSLIYVLGGIMTIASGKFGGEWGSIMRVE